MRERDVALAVTTLSFDIAVSRAAPAARRRRRDRPRASATRPPTATRCAALLASARASPDAGDAGDVAAAARGRLAGNPRATALCGGEAMPRDLAAELLPLRRRAVELATARPRRRCGRASTASSAPTGRSRSAGPIANTTLHVLDERCAAGAARRGRRALHRRRRRHPRLPRPTGADRRAIRSGYAHPIPAALDSRRRRLYRTGDSAAGAPTACSSASAAPTSRSSCAATASSSARSRPRSRATRRSPGASSSCARIAPGDVRLIALRRRCRGARCPPTSRCARTSRARCPTTWCRSGSSRCRAAADRRTARSIARRCPRRRGAARRRRRRRRSRRARRPRSGSRARSRTRSRCRGSGSTTTSSRSAVTRCSPRR